MCFKTVKGTNIGKTDIQRIPVWFHNDIYLLLVNDIYLLLVNDIYLLLVDARVCKN